MIRSSRAPWGPKWEPSVAGTWLLLPALGVPVHTAMTWDIGAPLLQATRTPPLSHGWLQNPPLLEIREWGEWASVNAWGHLPNSPGKCHNTLQRRLFLRKCPPGSVLSPAPVSPWLWGFVLADSPATVNTAVTFLPLSLGTWIFGAPTYHRPKTAVAG